MNDIPLEDVAKKYNQLEIIWNEKDKWHLHTKKMISSFIKTSLQKLPYSADFKILNAGSAGYSYELNEDQILHVDIAENRLKNLSNSLVADIQHLPLPSQQFNLIICVGSVINYCDPILVIKELKRLLRPSGHIILEFENSFSLELLGTAAFNKKATIVNSFYNGEPEKVWFFSETYIRELAALYQLRSIAHDRCHILSPFIYRLFKNEMMAARFGKLDPLLARIPLIRRFSSNTILLLTSLESC